jgi:hypothetical protein
MSSSNPPELPKLPPIRESAEHVVPPPGDEASAEDWGSDGVEEQPPESTQQATMAAARSEARRRTPRQKPRREERGTPQEARPVAPDPPAGGGRGGRGSRTEDGLRYSTAGHGLIVALLGLVFGALLLAPGMHKSAFNGQPGTKRDVSLALTGGLAHVSHALLLDRPRSLVQDAMGRDHADEIDVAIVVPPTTVSPNPSTTPTTKPTKPVVAKPPARQKFTPQKKLRLWIAGDSLVITPGYSIVRAAGGSPVIQSVGGIDGHIATGLTRPDVFNWFNELTTQVKALHPNVVVLNFGANDDHSYMTGLPDGVSVGSFASPEWVKEYGRRVGAVMDTVNRAGGVVVWIGLPIARSPTQTQEFDRINAIVLREAKLRPRKVIFIDTYTMFAGDDGGFAEYLENDKGDTVKVRAGDGVHFETAGGDMIAREVLKQLNLRFDLTSWRKQQSP